MDFEGIRRPVGAAAPEAGASGLPEAQLLRGRPADGGTEVRWVSIQARRSDRAEAMTPRGGELPATRWSGSGGGIVSSM